MKKRLLILAIMASIVTIDEFATSANSTINSCAAATYDYNSDGYIHKGTITLIAVVSGKKKLFHLFNKGGVDYVSKSSKGGPFYRLTKRMTIDNIAYTY